MISLLQTIFDHYILLKTQNKYSSDCRFFGKKICASFVDQPGFDRKMCLVFFKLVVSLI